MKIAILFVFTLAFGQSFAQQPVLLDSTMQKALNEKGYSDTKINFRNFAANAPGGLVFTNESLKGKTTFINFWFEGCAPCEAEFDALNALYEKYKDNKNFQFVSITFEPSEDIHRLARKHHLTYPIFHLDRDKIYDVIFQLGFPTNIITDASGKISFIKSGGPIEKQKAQQEFNRLYTGQVERLLLPQ